MCLSEGGRRRQYMPLLAVQTPLHFYGVNVPTRDTAKSEHQYSLSRLQLETLLVCKVSAQPTSSSVVHAAVPAKSRAEISESRSCAVSSASCCAGHLNLRYARALQRRPGFAIGAGPSRQLKAWGTMDACTLQKDLLKD